jgi:hypothetical protein
MRPRNLGLPGHQLVCDAHGSPAPPSQTNVSVCSSLGHPFVTQFNLIFLDTLAVYK